MRVGIIGVKAIAPLHINALLARGQEIAALCDADILRCKKAKEKFGLASAEYSDYIAMLDKERLDAVHICTPHYLHAEMICESLKRGINVLSEKPVAISLEQLNQIERAVKSSAAQLGVCFQNRFNESVRFIRDFLKGKEIKAASVTLVWERGAAYYAQDKWRGTKDKEGGGVMINQAIHGLDLMQLICGMPKSVIAFTSNNSLKDEIEVEDSAFGIFKLEGGGNFIVNATNAAKFCFPVYSTFRTEQDTVELSGDNIIINGKLITKSDGLPIFGKEVWGTGHINLIRNFYDCLETGEKFSIDFYEGQKTVRMILSMYESNGKEIAVF